MEHLVPLIKLPLLAKIYTPVAFLFFILVIAWVYRSGRTKLYKKMAELPLDD
ncbi:MAG: cbb3-type cytochrome c oxidase subunit 3 [Candidatus Dadabacteria bacterium]|nr:MAG: cbb3-type cytochrome c oxidase subunit 3 [Candidatus Dadabacteria bacterium]